MQGTKKKLGWLQWAIIGSCVVMVVIGIGFIVGGVSSNTSFETEAVANHATIKELKQTIEDMEADKEAKKEALSKYTNTASEVGIAVATIQSAYSPLDPVTQGESVVENGEKLKTYFSEKEHGHIKPWFTPSKGKIDYIWTFRTTFSFVEDKVDVIWLCTNTSKDTILAYTTGVFDVATNQFSDMKIRMTEKGLEYTDAEKLKEHNDVIDSLFSGGGDSDDD